MVTYTDVKTKINNLRKQILADMTYKRAERAKIVFDNVQVTVQYILSQIANILKAKADVNVDNYAVQLYKSTPVNAIGEKKVAVDYNDTTTVINNRTVIPFDTFSYDPNLYDSNVKSFADALSKRMIVMRIPQAETPPVGDFEDVSYTYYRPTIFYPANDLEFDVFGMTGQYGYLPRFAEFDLYGLQFSSYRVDAIKGMFDYFSATIGGLDVTARISTGGVLTVTDPNTGDSREIAYKFVVFASNGTNYTVEVMIGNKPHRVNANSDAIYVYLTDIHLKATPIKIL